MSTKRLDQIADKWKEYIEDHPRIYEPNISTTKTKESENSPHHEKKKCRTPLLDRHCQKCGKPFQTHSANAKYCAEHPADNVRLKQLKAKQKELKS